MQYTINNDWKFHLGDIPAAWTKDYDTADWKNVTIPHDWSVAYPFDEKNSSGTGYLSGGIGWYKKNFSLPLEQSGKRVIITFDGVYKNAKLWINGYYLGKRPYGYTTFSYDVTDFACFGETENQVTVRVEHTDVADSRWFTGNGIYRKVSLTVKNQISIDTNGSFITTPVAAEKESVVNSNVTLTNHTSSEEKITVKTTIFDGENIVTSEAKECLIVANQTITVDNECKLSNAKLWSPDRPNLYSVKNEIFLNGESIDTDCITTGIRIADFDPDKGFFLNGKSLKMKGVCVHHDAGCLGSAVREKVWERRLQKLKAMGCNAIRMSHNPHMPELYDLCDKMGFLVDDEAFDEWEGVKNKWSTGHNVYPPAHFGYYEDFPQWHEADLRDLILRDRNHPSVILWSIGNEIDYPNDPYCHEAFQIASGNNDKNKPAAERVYNPNRPHANRLVTISKKLVEIAKKYDKTRPITAALAFPELSNITTLSDTLEVVGYNYRENMYLDDHKKYPNRIILGSENGHGAKEWKAVRDNDFIASQFLWTGIDFLGETVGWPYHGSQAGELDIAGNEKPGYYLRKSWWNESPMVYLTTKSKDDELSVWDYNDGEKITINCYTNCERAELLLNGEVIAKGILADYEEMYIPFEAEYKAGNLTVIGYNGETEVCRYEIKTGKQTAAIKATALETTINADGQDMTHIEVLLVDANGDIAVRADNKITVSIAGNATLMGIESGALNDFTSYTESYRHAKNGRLLIYISSTQQKGDITVTLTSAGLTEAVVKVKAV